MGDPDETSPGGGTAARRTAFAPTTPLDPGLTRLASTADTIVPPTELPEPSAGALRLEDRYRVAGLLGAGGMGEVRLSRDQWIGRDVAIKTMHVELGASGAARARFLREIRVQGQLEHPAIVPVYDLGVGPAGEPFFTMRRVRGSTLASVLVGLGGGDEELAQRFSRRRLLTAFSSVCLAVHYAHSRGVVHRDLKPGNVMLGDFGEVYVLDWGIAKLVGAPESDDALPTEGESTGGGRIVGTLGYMAPEQAFGEAIDARTDVYALGVILFEILTLQNLIVSTNALDALDVIRSGVDARPSVRAPERDVPPELEAICVRATATEPAARFASAKELSEAVERFLDGDRDVERRRELAVDCVVRAEQLVERATTGGASPDDAHEARVAGLREVFHALALDPEGERARQALARLVLEPGKEMPRAAAAERAVMRGRERAEGARLVFRAYVAFVLSFPLMVVAGVRIPWLVYGGWVVVGLTALIAHHLWKSGQIDFRRFSALLWASAAVVLIQSTWLGPFVLTPVAATLTTSMFALYANRRERPWVLAAGLFMTTVPFALGLMPGLPRAFSFEAGDVVLHPRALGLPPVATMIGLVYTSVTYAILPAVFLFGLRDTLREADDRVFLQAWTLRRLFPEDEGRREGG